MPAALAFAWYVPLRRLLPVSLPLLYIVSPVSQAKYADDVIFPMDGKPRVVSVPLLESAWRKDPKNTLMPWTAPSQCEMVEVLGDISSLRILGDQTKWYESVAIDRVSYSVGSSVPLACSSIYY